MRSLHRLLQNGLNRLLRHPIIVLSAGLVVTLFSIYVTQKIQLRTNFADLLPDNHPAVVEAKEIEKIVGGASFLVVTVRSEDPQAADRFLTEFNKQIEQIDGIRYIDDRPPSDFFRKNGLLYLSLPDLDELYKKVERRIERGKLKKAQLFIDLEEGHGIDQEFEGFKKRYATYLQATPRYQSLDGKLFVSLIKPEWRATNSDRTKSLLQQLDQVILKVNPASFHPSLQVRFTGPYVKALTQQKILLKDAVLVSILSLVGAVLYLLVHFRSLRPVFLIGLPLTVGVSWALAAAYLFFGSLNLFSAAACAILLGLGADYGIHIYSGYIQERAKGVSVIESLAISMRHLGRAFLVASTTTAAAFFSLTLTEFKALFEFGVISGCGLFLTVFSFLTLFPSLVLIMERWRPARLKLPRYGNFAISFPRFFNTRGLVIITLLLLLPLLAVGLGKLSFDYNLNHVLGAQETKGLDAEVDRIFNHTVNPEVALVRDRNDAKKLARSLRETQQKLPPNESTISQVLSLDDLVPTNQAEKMKRISRLRALFTPSVIKGFSPEERRSYDQFKSLLNPSEVSLSQLPESLLTKFKDLEGETGRLVFIFPNFDPEEADKLGRFVETVRDVQCPNCSASFYASGDASIFYEIVQMLFREGKYIIGFSVGAILLSLLLNYRSLSSTLITFAPLMIGFLSTLGWMGLLGISFNIINLAALPIILGTADDYSIHIYERYRANQSTSLSQIYRESFGPILGSALTTLIGFGSLWFANMGGVRSFGTVCAMGIFFCALTNLTWFPAFLAFIEKRPQEKTEPILIPQETLE